MNEADQRPERAVYFGIVVVNGREYPRLIYDELIKVERKRLVYCTRLDTLAGGDRMIVTPLADLMLVYERLKARSKLPPEDRGVPPKKADKGEQGVKHDVDWPLPTIRPKPA